jgi:hypothetical protein
MSADQPAEGPPCLRSAWEPCSLCVPWRPARREWPSRAHRHSVQPHNHCTVMAQQLCTTPQSTPHRVWTNRGPDRLTRGGAQWCSPTLRAAARRSRSWSPSSATRSSSRSGPTVRAPHDPRSERDRLVAFVMATGIPAPQAFRLAIVNRSHRVASNGRRRVRETADAWPRVGVRQG